MATLVVYKIRGTIDCVAVKTPGFADRMKEILQDIAALTGGEVISEEVGRNIRDISLELFGGAKSAKVLQSERKACKIFRRSGRHQGRSCNRN